MSRGQRSQDLVLPAHSEKHGWALELAVVIGRRAHRVRQEEELKHVLGCTIVNGIPTCDLVFRKDMPETGTVRYRSK